MKKTTHFRRIRPSFQTRGRNTHKKSATVESAGAFLGKFGIWKEEMEIYCRKGGKNNLTVQKTAQIEEDNNGDSCEREEEQRENNERDEVERRIEALQRIVPGADSLEVDKLFEKTAGYILCLQRQVKAFRTLSAIFESLDKEKTKCGC